VGKIHYYIKRLQLGVSKIAGNIMKNSRKWVTLKFKCERFPILKEAAFINNRAVVLLLFNSWNCLMHICATSRPAHDPSHTSSVGFTAVSPIKCTIINPIVGGVKNKSAVIRQRVHPLDIYNGERN
jgi:hypothetical protein